MRIPAYSHPTNTAELVHHLIYTSTHAAIPHSHSDLQKQIYFKKFLFSLCRFWTILAYGWISWWNIDLNWVFEYIHTKTNFQAIYCFVRTCCILAWIRVYGCLCCLCVFNSCLFFLSFYFLCFVSFIADIDMYITYFCVFFVYLCYYYIFFCFRCCCHCCLKVLSLIIFISSLFLYYYLIFFLFVFVLLLWTTFLFFNTTFDYNKWINTLAICICITWIYS